MKNGIKTLAIWLVIGVIILFVVPAVLDGTNKQMTYSELLSKIEAGEVTDISISYDGDSAKVKLKDDNSIKNVNLPGINNLLDNLNDSMKENNVNVFREDESFLATLGDWILPVTSIVMLFFLMMLFLVGNQAGQKGTMTFGKSRARLLNGNDKNKITFDDVA